MNEEVRQVPIQSAGSVSEAWQRHTDESGLRNVEADYVDAHGDTPGWYVAIWVMEFVRDDPLESEFRQRITNALRRVTGVTSAEEGDREHWFVTGQPSGKALVEAAAQGVDDLADQIRAYMQRLDDGDGDIYYV